MAFVWGATSGSASTPNQAKPATKLFAVEVSGKGPPMILIPGGMSSGDVWKGTVARYAARYQCHLLTLAGFAGRSRDLRATHEERATAWALATVRMQREIWRYVPRSSQELRR